MGGTNGCGKSDVAQVDVANIPAVSQKSARMPSFREERKKMLYPTVGSLPPDNSGAKFCVEPKDRLSFRYGKGWAHCLILCAGGSRFCRLFLSY